MLCKKMGVYAVLLVMVVAAQASADIVASHAGPTNFDGATIVGLADVSIGQEGRVDLEFKVDDLSEARTLWYLADTPGGTLGEYRIVLTAGEIAPYLWAGAYRQPAINQSFTDTTNWHTASLAWKNGGNVQLTLDGVTTEGTLTGPLSSFTSDGEHVIGANAWGGGTAFLDGTLRNVVVRNTYEVPEPSAFVLLGVGLLGLLAYAWRKRR